MSTPTPTRLSFTVAERPIPYVRMTSRTVYGRNKDGTPTKQAQRALAYLAYKDQVGWTARLAGAVPIEEGNIALEVVVLLPEPKRPKRPPTPGSRGRRRATGDLSNYVKAVEDGLNGVAWRDDEQISEIHAWIVYVAGLAPADSRLTVSYWQGPAEALAATSGQIG